MTLALHINDDELFKLGCYPESPVGLFWAKFAERRPTAVPDMEKVCKKIAQTIEHDYCAESVEDMPKLLRIPNPSVLEAAFVCPPDI